MKISLYGKNAYVWTGPKWQNFAKSDYTGHNGLLKI